ncbi:MAG TPA: TIGR02449 family protein [Wenzhouxiangellaceae bacterium]|nr:TIGR02449 family protein [Wenzhouxiangellaceae bacterium]
MSTQKVSRALDTIEASMNSLKSRVTELERENKSLLVRQEALVAERAGLVQRNEEARTRVESMIERLKSLENAG